MTPEAIRSAYDRMLGSVGETVKFRRYQGTGEDRDFIQADVTARVAGYEPREIVGSVQQGDRRVIVLADELDDQFEPEPRVSPNDKVIIRGKEHAIISVDANTRRVGGTMIAYEIQARG